MAVVEFLAVILLMQVKTLVHSIRAACERPVDKIDRQQLRKQAHQLADYCKDGGLKLKILEACVPCCHALPGGITLDSRGCTCIHSTVHTLAAAHNGFYADRLC